MKPTRKKSFSFGNSIWMVLKSNLNRFVFWCQTNWTSQGLIRTKNLRTLRKNLKE